MWYRVLKITIFYLLQDDHVYIHIWYICIYTPYYMTIYMNMKSPSIWELQLSCYYDMYNHIFCIHVIYNHHIYRYMYIFIILHYITYSIITLYIYILTHIYHHINPQICCSHSGHQFQSTDLSFIAFPSPSGSGTAGLCGVGPDQGGRHLLRRNWATKRGCGGQEKEEIHQKNILGNL